MIGFIRLGESTVRKWEDCSAKEVGIWRSLLNHPNQVIFDDIPLRTKHSDEESKNNQDEADLNACEDTFSLGSVTSEGFLFLLCSLGKDLCSSFHPKRESYINMFPLQARDNKTKLVFSLIRCLESGPALFILTSIFSIPLPLKICLVYLPNNMRIRNSKFKI